MITYSQNGEDGIIAKIFWETTGYKRTGFYVDVGCNHPIYNNNTFFFYQLGWNGICIDPHEAFREHYLKDRPRDVFAACAIADHDGSATLNYGEHISLASLLPSERNPRQCEVPCRRLSGLLSALHVPATFDILSVDVEGYEIEALKTLDLAMHRPRAMIVEYQTMSEINLDVQPFLVALGYQIIHMTAGNIIAINSVAEDWRLL
jgi:FkbM family methyltransferase